MSKGTSTRSVLVLLVVSTLLPTTSTWSSAAHLRFKTPPEVCYLDRVATSSYMRRWVPRVEGSGLKVPMEAVYRYGRASEAVLQPECVGGLLVLDTSVHGGRRPSLFVVGRRNGTMCFMSVLWAKGTKVSQKRRLFSDVREFVSDIV